MKQRNVGTRTRIALATLAALALSAGPAGATGFLTARFGGEHGNPTTTNPTAMYYNPAGLALGTGTRLYLDGTFAWVKSSYERDAAAPYPIVPAGQDKCPAAGATPPTCTGTLADDLGPNTGKATLFNIAAAPFIGAVTDFGVPNLGVGLGLYAPFGGASVWDKNDDYKDSKVYPGAYDGASRWWSIEGTLRSVYVTAAGAYNIPAANLSVGLGLNLIMSEIHTIRARNSSGQDEIVTQDKEGRLTPQEGRSRVEVAGKDVSLGVGLLWKPIPDLSVGLSYQSQPGFGTMKLEGDLELSLDGQPSNTDKIRLEQQLPDVIRGGVSWRLNPQWEARLFGEYDRWSVFERQCLVRKSAPDDTCRFTKSGSPVEGVDSSQIVQNLERDWQDALAVRAGASYYLSDSVELYAGLGFDGNAVPDNRIDPALPDFNDLSAALGGKVKLLADNALALGGTYTQIFYLSRDVKPRAKDAAGVPVALDTTSLQPDAAGKYERAIGVFNLNVEYTF